MYPISNGTINYAHLLIFGCPSAATPTKAMLNTTESIKIAKNQNSLIFVPETLPEMAPLPNSAAHTSNSHNLCL
jgi:hypothetical protein